MDERFSKLRFREFAKAATAGAILGALALQPVAARAATGSDEIHAGNGRFFVNTNITFSTTSSCSLAISSGSISNGGTTSEGAYHGGLAWGIFPGAVGGATAQNAYRDPGGTVTVTPNTGAGTIVTGPTYNPPLLPAGLLVSVQDWFAPSKAVARTTIFLQNTSGAPVTLSVSNNTNQGADNPVIQMTSSGDNPFNFSTDHWVVISNGSNPQPGGIPTTTYALGEAGAPAQATAISGPAADHFYWTYNNVTIPAGATQALMVFSQMSSTVGAAETDATMFNSSMNLAGAGYLAGLSPTQRAQIVNWNANSVPVPTLSEWAKIGMAGLLGLAGLFSFGLFRRRQRGAGAS
jgi:IPTL-CTERM motif